MNFVSKHAPQHDQSGSRRPIPDETSVSETIRKPPLVKAQTAFLKRKKTKIWRKTIFDMADGILTPCNVWHDHDIDYSRWLHPAMWHVVRESWQWIHQVAAPCNVTRSSGIMTLNSPGGSTLQCGRWIWDDMPLNSPKRPPYWISTSGFDFDHITAVDMSFCTSLQNFIQIGPPSAEKWRHSHKIRFLGSNNGFFEKPMYDFL